MENELLREAKKRFGDVHEGDCGQALEEGEEECTCGAEDYWKRVDAALEEGEKK